MKWFYGMIFLMNVMNVYAVKEKLTTRLERRYDLQLVQKKKDAELRKLLQSTTKVQKINLNNDQQKNVSNNKNVITNKKNTQIKKELYQPYSPCFIERVPFLFASVPLFTFVSLLAYKKLVLGMPIDCACNTYGVCKCLDI